MPVPEKKPITSPSSVPTPEASSPLLPEQEEFRQHLRRLAVSAVQVLIEQVMCEELDESYWSVMGRMHSPAQGLSQWVLHS
jgi:putative transposase